MEPEETTGSDASMVIKLTLDAFTAEKLLLKKPRSLPTATFCALLIEQVLDTPVTLAERAKASEASSSYSSSSIKEELLSNNINNTVEFQNPKKPKGSKRYTKTEYSEDFETFWKLYQSAPDRVSSQTKPKAFHEWKQIVAFDGAERLLEAARRAIEEQKRKKSADEFVGSLPDLFRWLRDGKYEVYLEEHKPQRAGRWWDEGNRCWVED
jgi:hypothetical protein